MVRHAELGGLERSLAADRDELDRDGRIVPGKAGRLDPLGHRAVGRQRDVLQEEFIVNGV